MDQESKNAEPSHERGGGSGHGWGCIWVPVAALLVVYVLSVGPLARYYRSRKVSPPKPIELFYSPVEWGYQHWRPAHLFFDWYIDRVWCAGVP